MCAAPAKKVGTLSQEFDSKSKCAERMKVDSIRCFAWQFCMIVNKKNPQLDMSSANFFHIQTQWAIWWRAYSPIVILHAFISHQTTRFEEGIYKMQLTAVRIIARCCLSPSFLACRLFSQMLSARLISPNGEFFDSRPKAKSIYFVLFSNFFQTKNNSVGFCECIRPCRLFTSYEIIFHLKHVHLKNNNPLEEQT